MVQWKSRYIAVCLCLGSLATNLTGCRSTRPTRTYHVFFPGLSLSPGAGRVPVASIPGPDPAGIQRYLVHVKAVADGEHDNALEVSVTGGVIPSHMEVDVELLGEDGRSPIDSSPALLAGPLNTRQEERSWRREFRVVRDGQRPFTVHVAVTW